MSGSWISVDGVEGAGKTTLVIELARRMIDAVVVSEFSAGPIGRMLATAVAISPHHICESPFAQSLFFVGELIERRETTIERALRAERLVLHDRGYLSKYAYQWAAMYPTMGDGADEVLRCMFRLLVPPTLSIVLTAPFEVIRERLIARDGECSDERLDFIGRADAILRNPPVPAGVVLTIDSSTATPVDIADRVLATALFAASD